MRIGKRRDGSKVGVFLYCQQHAREWATPLTCLETAEQLLRNYATDPTHAGAGRTTWRSSSCRPSNPDGSHYSMYNFASQRPQPDQPVRRLAARRPTTRSRRTSGGRGSTRRQGVAVHGDRSGGTYSVGRRPQPQQHRRHDLRRLHRRVVLVHQRRLRRPGRGVGAGDQERALDRGHVREHQVLEQHPQLRRLLHVGAGRVPAEPGRGRPRAREHRRREVLLRRRRPDPEPHQGVPRTRRSCRSGPGPIADVLYSAAGNSADEHWYKRDVIAYSFETGADLFFVNTETPPAAGGAARSGSTRTRAGSFT